MEENSITKSDAESGTHQQKTSHLCKMEESEQKQLWNEESIEQPQFSNGSKIWKNLSHMFTKSKTRHKDLTRITKQRNASLVRIGSYFKSKKLSCTTLTLLSSTGISPTGFQAAFTEKKMDHKNEKIMAIAIKLPEGVAKSDVAVTLELNMLQNAEFPSSDITGIQESMKMYCAEETDSQTVFTGLVKIHGGTDFIKLVTIPLYLLDSTENGVLQPGSEFMYKSIIKTSNERLLESEKDDVKVTLTFSKMCGIHKTSLLPIMRRTLGDETGKLEENRTLHCSDGHLRKFKESQGNPEQLPNNQFTNYASCELDFKDDDSISDSGMSWTSAAKYVEEDIYDHSSSNLTESTPNKNHHKFYERDCSSQPSTSHDQFRKRSAQNISTQCSLTNVMLNKEVDAQTSFFKYNWPLSVVEPSDSLSTTLSYELNEFTYLNGGKQRKFMGTPSYPSNDMSVWPSSSTTTTTEYSDTWQSCTSDSFSTRQVPPSNIVASNNHGLESKNGSFEFIANQPDTAKFSLNFKHTQKSWSPISTMAFKTKPKISKEYPVFCTTIPRATVDIKDKCEASNFEEEICSTDLSTSKGSKVPEDAQSTLSNIVDQEGDYKSVDNASLLHKNCKRFLKPRWEELRNVDVCVNKTRVYEDNDEYYEKHRGDVKEYFQNRNLEGNRWYLPQAMRNFNSLLSGDNADESLIASNNEELEENSTHKQSLQQPDFMFSYVTNANCSLENKLSVCHKPNSETVLSNNSTTDKGSIDGFSAKVEGLKACILQMSDIWTSSIHNDKEIERMAKVNVDEVAHTNLSEERERTYEKAESDIKKVIEELLSKSRDIKENAILNGAKEEVDPAIIVDYIKEQPIDYTELCSVMVDEMEKFQQKNVNNDTSRDNVNEVAQQDVSYVIDSLLDEVLNKSTKAIIPYDPINQDAHYVENDAETRVLEYQDIGKSIATRNFEKEQNDINSCLNYFCKCNHTDCKIPKTSFSFGEISENDLYSSSTSLKDDLSGVSSQNFVNSQPITPLINDPVSICESTSEANGVEESSVINVTPDKIESEESDNIHSITGADSKSIEISLSIDRNQPNPKDFANESKQSTNTSKSCDPQNFTNLTDIENDMPSTSTQLKEFTTTDEEGFLLNIDLITGEDLRLSVESKILLPQPYCIYSRTKDVCHSQEHTSSEDEENDSPNFNKCENTQSSDTAGTSSSSSANYTSVNVNPLVLNQEDRSYIALKQKPAVYNMQRGISCNPTDATDDELDSTVSGIHNDSDSDADDENEKITANLNLPKQRYKSKQELNSPQELAYIERNLTVNDTLTKISRIVLVPSKTASEIHHEVSEADEHKEMVATKSPIG